MSEAGPAAPDFVYRDGALHAEGVALARIADELGTPVYVYSAAHLERQYRRFASALAASSPEQATSALNAPLLSLCFSIVRTK